MSCIQPTRSHTRAREGDDVRVQERRASWISRRKRSWLTAAAISGGSTFTTMRRPSAASCATKTRLISLRQVRVRGGRPRPALPAAHRETRCPPALLRQAPLEQECTDRKQRCEYHHPRRNVSWSAPRELQFGPADDRRVPTSARAGAFFRAFPTGTRDVLTGGRVLCSRSLGLEPLHAFCARMWHADQT